MVATTVARIVPEGDETRGGYLKGHVLCRGYLGWRRGEMGST